MKFQFDDGGRAEAGYKGRAGDCVCRAIVIASGKPYHEVYLAIAKGNVTQRASKHTRARTRTRSAAHGVYVQHKWFKDYMHSLGFVWYPTMSIGSGCKVHLKDGELPMGRLVVSLSRHYAAVIDGTLHDTYQEDRDGTRCVYGYWRFEEKSNA